MLWNLKYMGSNPSRVENDKMLKEWRKKVRCSHSKASPPSICWSDFTNMSIINQNINFTTKEVIKKFSHGARNLSFLVSPKPIYLITTFYIQSPCWDKANSFIWFTDDKLFFRHCNRGSRLPSWDYLSRNFNCHKILGVPRFEPVTAGYKAPTLPQCNAVPLLKWTAKIVGSLPGPVKLYSRKSHRK